MNPTRPAPTENEADLLARKRALRTRMRAARAALTPEARAAESAAACKRLLAMPPWTGSRTLAAYLSIGEEFDTAALVREALRSGRRLLLPRIVDPHSRDTRHLILHEVRDPDVDTVAGPWGIHEPDPGRCPEVPAAAADLVLVPGLAFDATGGRLGYGAGYYDRLLAQVGDGCVKVAAAFELQCVDRVPMQAHDRRIDWLVTAASARRASGA